MSSEEITRLIIILWFIGEWLLRLLALFVVPRNRKPTAGMAWLLVIFLQPTIGWLVFLVFGSTKLPKNRRDAQETLEGLIAITMQQVAKANTGLASEIAVTPPRKYQEVSALATHLTNLPLFGGNDISVIHNYNAIIASITADINAATSFVHIEYYILALDEATEPFFDAISAARQRGVTVRVLYDAFGSRKFPRRKEMLKRLRSEGVMIQAMLPITLVGQNATRPDLRNHRKLVVVDGTTGYTGSFNMIERAYHRRDRIVYDELVIRMEGPVVAQLEAVFVTDWNAETGEIVEDALALIEQNLRIRGTASAQIIPSGPGYEYENNLKVFTSALYAATRSITIVNPYFVPDDSLSLALVSAAQRGVEVTLVNSEAIDQAMVAHAQHSYYEEMLKAGVKIRLYKAPTLLHSKYMLIDDDVALIGSSNMDIRSFQLNHELTVTVFDAAIIADLHRVTAGYIKRTRQVSKSAWKQRPKRKQLLDNLARLTSSIQ